VEFSISIPTDESGFIRRECPNCEREVKWFAGETVDRPSDFLEPDLYTCPYCGERADHDQWWTPAQIEYAKAAAMGPISRGLEAEMKKILGNHGKYTAGSHSAPDLLVDPDDMLMVAPPCHPFEPLKVIETWSDPLHCRLCGAQFTL